MPGLSPSRLQKRGQSSARNYHTLGPGNGQRWGMRQTLAVPQNWLPAGKGNDCCGSCCCCCCCNDATTKISVYSIDYKRWAWAWQQPRWLEFKPQGFLHFLDAQPTTDCGCQCGQSQGSVSVVSWEMPATTELSAAVVVRCGGLGVGSAATYNWQTVKPFLWHFRCVCLPQFTMQQRHIPQREQERGRAALPRLALPVATKVYTQSIWTAFHYGTQLPGLAKANANANAVGAILKTLWLPPSRPVPRLPPVGKRAPNEAYKWPLSCLQLELKAGSIQNGAGQALSELPRRATSSGQLSRGKGKGGTDGCLYCRVRVQVCVCVYIVLANILMTIGIFIEFMQKLQISFGPQLFVPVVAVVVALYFFFYTCAVCVVY